MAHAVTMRDDDGIQTRKRARKGAACAACRRKKYVVCSFLHPTRLQLNYSLFNIRRRCDGGRPTCALCVQDSEPECVYTVLKLRPRTALLQLRIDELESQITALESTRAPNAVAQTKVLLHPGRASPSSIDIAWQPPSSCSSLKMQREYISQKFQALVRSRDTLDPLFGSWWKGNEQPPSGLVGLLCVNPPYLSKYTR